MLPSAVAMTDGRPVAWPYQLSIRKTLMPSSSWPTMPVGCSGRNQFSSTAVIELCVAGKATSSYGRAHSSR